MRKTALYAEAFLATSPRVEELAWIATLRHKKSSRQIQKFLSLLSGKASEELVKEFEMPERVARFLQVLIEEKAINELSKISSQIISLAVKNKVIFSTISYPNKLDKQFIDKLLGNIEKDPKADFIIETKRDDSLISGIRLESISAVRDLSLKFKLKNFKHHLMS